MIQMKIKIVKSKEIKIKNNSKRKRSAVEILNVKIM